MKPKALNKTAFLRVLTIGCFDEIEQHDVNYKMFFDSSSIVRIVKTIVFTKDQLLRTIFVFHVKINK